MSVAVAATFAVRCGLVMLFLPFSALDKIIGFKAAASQCAVVFNPRPLAIAALSCALTIEVVGSLGVVSGVGDRAAALVMAGYCAVTAVLFKRFWTKPDLFSDAQGEGRTLMWDFLKNLSLGAGFLLIVVGTDGAGLAPFLADPLASSHPYAAYSNVRSSPT